MWKRWVVACAAVVAAVAAVYGAVVLAGAKPANVIAQTPPANTARVEKGRLSDMVSQGGILTYRARSDGSPYVVINQARGTYTELPISGDTIDCGRVLYRVNNHPVLLLCGSTPVYRSLSQGDSGPDVAELNANLVQLGCASRAQLDPSSDHFGSATASALKQLQSRFGEAQTGALHLGQAVFLPQSVRVGNVTGELGGSARPGTQVLYATSDNIEVQLALDPSQQGAVKAGDRARITLPGYRSVTGQVDRLGRVAQLPSAQNANPTDATIPAYISLDLPEMARGLDQAPVQVDITTGAVENALSVPVTAIVATSGGGFAVEVVHAGGRRELVAVKLGLFDTAGGRVQVVQGHLHVGDRVVVPSS